MDVVDFTRFATALAVGTLLMGTVALVLKYTGGLG